MEEEKKEMREPITIGNKSRRIMRTYPEDHNEEDKPSIISEAIDGVLDFIFNGKIDFKKDSDGIHLKIDKDGNK